MRFKTYTEHGVWEEQKQKNAELIKNYNGPITKLPTSHKPKQYTAKSKNYLLNGNRPKSNGIYLTGE